MPGISAPRRPQRLRGGGKRLFYRMARCNYLGLLSRAVILLLLTGCSSTSSRQASAGATTRHDRFPPNPKREQKKSVEAYAHYMQALIYDMDDKPDERHSKNSTRRRSMIQAMKILVTNRVDAAADPEASNGKGTGRADARDRRAGELQSEIYARLGLSLFAVGEKQCRRRRRVPKRRSSTYRRH